MESRYGDLQKTPSRPRYWAPAVLSLCCLSFVLTYIGWKFPRLAEDLLLRPHALSLPALLTFHFYHADYPHLLSTFLVLFVAGGVLEMRWGFPRFLAFYFAMALATGISTALWASLAGETAPSCGAAGVAFASLVTVGLLHPGHRFAAFLPPARHLVWFAVFLLGAALLYAQSARGGPFYLIPQVAGVPFGMLLYRCRPWCSAAVERWRARREAERERRFLAMRYRVDDLLEKISTDGIGSLTADERLFLERASKHYRSS